MVPFGQNLAPLRSAIEVLEDWKFFKTVLIIPYKRDKIPLVRFSIPLFQHSIIPIDCECSELIFFLDILEKIAYS